MISSQWGHIQPTLIPHLWLLVGEGGEAAGTLALDFTSRQQPGTGMELQQARGRGICLLAAPVSSPL
jgi:hypothetical protein